MIVAEHIVGKLVLFICQMAAKGIPKLKLDQRKKACRSLTKLYYCLQALDEVTESIFCTVSKIRKTSTGVAYAVIDALSCHMHEIELATNMFVDLGIELYEGLEIIDPALAKCCDALYFHKFSFLTQISHSVVYEGFGQDRRIVIMMPLNPPDVSGLEGTYSAAQVALRNGDTNFWPDTWDSADGEQEVIISWENSSSSDAFLQELAQHRTVLVEAKEKLRELLKSSFLIEELLFQTDTLPHR